MAGHETNLASEFHVLSCLYRLGLDAHLTLANKKAVDIVVVRGPSDVITIDVKAVAKRMDWPIGSKAVVSPDRHFVIFVCYNDSFANVASAPDTWIVPFAAIEQLDLAKPYKGGMRVMSRARLLKDGMQFKEAWHSLDVAAEK
jgi:hypothetical protein